MLWFSKVDECKSYEIAETAIGRLVPISRRYCEDCEAWVSVLETDIKDARSKSWTRKEMCLNCFKTHIVGIY